MKSRTPPMGNQPAGPDLGPLQIFQRQIAWIERQATQRIQQAPLTPIRVAEIVAGAHGAADGDVAEIVAQAESQYGHKLGCHSGCHWCCHQSFEVSVVEAAAIAARIHPNDAASTAAKALALADQLLTISKPDRYKRGIPCVFLEGTLCGIYEARPSPCRSYFSLSARACRKDWNRRLDAGRSAGVPILENAQAASATYNCGVDLAFHRAGLEVEHVELSRAVGVLLEPGALDRWIAGERLFEPWRRISPNTGLAYSQSLPMAFEDDLLGGY